MSKIKINFKEEAQKALIRGEWKKALEYFQKHYSQNPQDLRSKQKIGELLERMEKKKDAIEIYREIAEDYANEGFHLKAISVYKKILRIDPSINDVNDRILQLYTEKKKQLNLPRFLPKVPLLSELNEEELHSLLNFAHVKSYRKGELICQEGEEGDSIMIICSGEVMITKQNREGKEIKICTLAEGDIFGEFGFFLDKKRHASVSALTELEVLEISGEELNKIIKTNPHMKESLQGVLKKRVLDILLTLSPLFSLFDHKEREELFKKFHLRKFPKDTLIFKGGDPSTSIYIIKSGEVEIFTQDQKTKKISIAKLGSGNFFGEIGVLLNTYRTAFAKTTKDTELFELKKEDFKEIVSRYPRLQSFVKEISLKRLSHMKEILFQEEILKSKEALV